MPLQTKPEDFPAAVRFQLADQDRALEVTCSLVTDESQSPYRIAGGAPHFADRDAFKAKIVEVGMTPAVAEDQGRSFNATGRQLRELGFSVDLIHAQAAA